MELDRAYQASYRLGDPLITVEAPADAQQVVAIMANGEVKPLAYNARLGRWEARFDVPVYAREGEYVITVVIVLKDGTRKVVTISYRVDLTAPAGLGKAEMIAGDGQALRLELDGDDDTARVIALLPWGERVELRPSAMQPHRFFATALVPPSHQGQRFGVTYIITDHAHNRGEVIVGISGD